MGQSPYDGDIVQIFGRGSLGNASGIAAVGGGLDHDLSGQVMPIPQHNFPGDDGISGVGAGNGGMPPPGPPALRKSDSDEWPSNPALIGNMPGMMMPPPQLKKAD